MKIIFLQILCLFCFNTFSQIVDTISIQNDRLDINYGAFKTSYFSNNNVIDKKEFKSILFTVEEAKSEYLKGKTYLTFAYIIGLPSGLLLLVQLRDFKSNPPYPEVFIGSIIGTAGGILLDYIGRSKVKKSIIIFNNERINTTFNLNPNGIGFAINF